MIGVLVTELFDEKQTSATQPRAEDHDGRDIRYIIIIQGGYTLKKKNIAAAMLAASMPLLSISAAHATPDTASTTPSQTQQQGEQRETQQSTSKQDVEVTQELVEKYSQYVSQEGDQFRLNAPENLKSDNAQVLREGCAFANGVVVSRSYRCPNFRLCCRHSHRYSNHPSMLINQTHHYHNYSPPDTSPHYNMQ